jgi:Mrp family chromosome partitioning ATPase/capsular polysaccharide biosynthesis protein
MTLAQYWTILVKQRWIVITFFVVVGLGAYIGSRLMTPIYRSTVLVQIAIHSGNNQADVNSLLASDQLVQTESQLAVSDTVLREVASHYKGLTFEQLSKEVTSTVKLNTQLFEIDVEDPGPTRAAALANGVATTLIKQQLQAAQQDNSRSQQQIQMDLENTQRQINSITSQLGQLQAQENGIVEAQKEAELQAQRLNQTPQLDPQQVKREAALQAQISALQTQLSDLQQHYSEWQTILAQLELTEAQNSDFLRVVQVAQPARTPVRPQVLLYTGAGLLTGLLLGMLLAVLSEQLDTRIRTAEALTQLLGWSVLTTVWKERSKEDLINPTGGNTNVESYRILRTNIGFSTIDKPSRTLMVTSSTPRDGKSVIASNLAIFMAKAGKHTLLIDADLRRPSLCEKFALSTDKMGLSNAILAFSRPTTANIQSHSLLPTPSTAEAPSGATAVTELSFDPFVHSVDIPNLFVMPSGPLPPNPSELLDSKAMQRFFTALAGYGAEVVIFDVPPLLGLSDASILASKVDGTLIVVDIMGVTKGHLKQAKALMAQAGAYVLGCVVNKQRRSRNDTIYSYYYSTDEQNRRGNHTAKNMSPSAVSPVTPDVLKPPETESQAGLLDGRKGR